MSGKNKGSGFFSKLLTVLIVALLVVCGYCIYNIVVTKADLSSQEKLFDDYRSLVKSVDDDSSAEETSTQESDDMEQSESSTSEESSGKSKKRKSTHDYSDVYAMNSDFVGWITVKNTNIDYPVVQTPDEPEYYLRRDLNGDYATAGTCFVGDCCDVDSTSFVIYGHNMNNDTMFGTLDYYKEEDFYKENPTFEFNTMNEDRTYRVFAAFEISIYDSEFKYFACVGDLDEEAYGEFIDNCKSYSMYDTGETPEYDTQILMLSTCSYHTDGGRFVVAAYLADEDE